MTLAAGCPRCSAPVTDEGGGWHCEDHGPITPLWRPRAPSYATFSEHLGIAGSFPTLLPWPMNPGWHVVDHGVVGTQGAAQATVTGVAGSSPLDGTVEVLVVTEEPGTGLGARCAGTVHS